MELLMKPNGTKQKTQTAVRAHITLKSLCWKVSMVQPKDNTLFNTPSKGVLASNIGIAQRRVVLDLLMLPQTTRNSIR